MNFKNERTKEGRSKDDGSSDTDLHVPPFWLSCCSLVFYCFTCKVLLFVQYFFFSLQNICEISEMQTKGHKAIV